MNLHDRLYAFFSANRTGHPPSVTNLSGLYGGDSIWLSEHCTTALAMNRLKHGGYRKPPSGEMMREWIAVCMRWHFYLLADEVGNTENMAREKLAAAQRGGDARQCQTMRDVIRMAAKRSEYCRRECQKWGVMDVYTSGMERLGAMLGDKVA